MNINPTLHRIRKYGMVHYISNTTLTAEPEDLLRLVSLIREEGADVLFGDMPSRKLCRWVKNKVLIEGFREDLINMDINDIEERATDEYERRIKTMREQLEKDTSWIFKPIVVKDRDLYEKCISVMPEGFMWHEDEILDSPLFNITDFDVTNEVKREASGKRIEAMLVMMNIIEQQRGK